LLIKEAASKVHYILVLIISFNLENLKILPKEFIVGYLEFQLLYSHFERQVDGNLNLLVGVRRRRHEIVMVFKGLGVFRGTLVVNFLHYIIINDKIE
jgi:hypothetical protein